MRLATRSFLFLLGPITLSLFLVSQAFAQADLFIRDTTTDTGVEPYTGPNPVYLSPDIWVRHNPDPNYDPYPFPTVSPAWTPDTHQNPEYRDTKTSQPNYVYVRIHNRGDTPSSGTERLKLYQAKASTGLGWPVSWVDNVDMACGQDLLHGIEITKPRRNAKNVSTTERRAYRDAVIAIQTDSTFQYSDGVQYFEKQNIIHSGAGNPEHGNPAFLPWHREMVNRFEHLLREQNPLLTMLYWDFTQNPTSGTNLFNNDFMGPSSGTVTGPLGSALPITISRNVGAQSCVFDNDATLLGSGPYNPFSEQVEASPNHDCSHGHIGGIGGAMSSLATAVRDPFFFQLHGNVDRQWATWQRDGADPTRLDPIATYGTDSSNTRINGNMSPWDGDTGLPPWSGAAAYSKTSKNPSVVYPPIYDTAPLRIPVLQPDESVVVEIPWYPPNVNSFNCAGQAGHFCLLARIETQTGSPFGMSVPETTNVSTNTRNNNNIAWKNLTIVDDMIESSLMLISGTTIHNFFDQEAIFLVTLVDRTLKRRFLLHEFADMAIALPDEILKRVDDNQQIHDLEFGELKGLNRKVLRITGKEPVFRIRMKPGERFTMEFSIQMQNKKLPRELLVEPLLFDVEQTLDLPSNFFDRSQKDMLGVGGVRFEVDIGRALDKNLAENAAEILAAPNLKLEIDRLRGLKSLEAVAQSALHLSPREPVNLIVTKDDPNNSMLRLTLEVDNEEIAIADDAKQLSRKLSFDKPGVHTIEVRGLSSDGERVQRRARVLVSENIPPTVAILSPESGIKIKVGETVTIVAETAPAFQREVGEVTLHVKDDGLFQGGLNLIASDYPIVDRSNGPGSRELNFKPEKSGTYMLQVGARDDEGNLGVSGHVMIVVSE